MTAQSTRVVTGSLVMWLLAAAWWVQGDRSLTAAAGALVLGSIGTAIAAWEHGSRRPRA